MAWGDILKVGGAILGGATGIPGGVAIGGALGGALGGLFGGGSEEQAARQAAEQSNQGFNYLKASPLGTEYLPTGGAANNAMAQLLGVGGAGGAPDEAATIAKIKAGLQSWSASSGETGNTAPVLKLIEGGAPLASVQQALTQLRATTTHPRNIAFLDPLIQQAGSPVMGAGAPGGGFDNAFANYRKSTGYDFRLKEGMRAITGNMASKGVLGSGATLQVLQDRGQAISSPEFGNYLGQLGMLADSGLSAGGTIGGQAGAGGTNAAQYTAAAGAARGADINDAGKGIGIYFENELKKKLPPLTPAPALQGSYR